jgi:hypothetical protein
MTLAFWLQSACKRWQQVKECGVMVLVNSALPLRLAYSCNRISPMLHFFFLIWFGDSMTQRGKPLQMNSEWSLSASVHFWAFTRSSSSLTSQFPTRLPSCMLFSAFWVCSRPIPSGYSCSCRCRSKTRGLPQPQPSFLPSFLTLLQTPPSSQLPSLLQPIVAAAAPLWWLLACFHPR